MSPWLDFHAQIGLECPTHDHRPREWRHLDTCGIATMIEADVPRVDCKVHGVRQAKVPWAEPGSGFTAMFEAMAISWLKVAPTNAVSERMMISWDEAWGIMERAVRRGIERREAAPIEELAIDETSFQKRHEYVTVLVNRKTGVVVDVLDDRKKATLKKWLQANKDQLREVRSISMDMWEPFITAVQESVRELTARSALIASMSPAISARHSTRYARPNTGSWAVREIVRLPGQSTTGFGPRLMMSTRTRGRSCG